MKKIKENWFTILVGMMFLFAIPPIWPYSYFQILRLVVCGVAIYNTFKANEIGNYKWVFIMGSIAILFNPLFPINLQKETWAVLDLLTSFLIFISITKITK